MPIATASMDFFQHQDQAKKKTSVLVFYYFLAVILIMLAVYLAFAAVLIGVETQSDSPTNYRNLWNPALFFWVTVSTLVIVISGSLFKISQMSGGGTAVAEMLGGRLVTHNTNDLDELKALNVVEEMAIASGTPVPPVYMLDNEDGINAFAAGFTPNDAVIGVTRGCVSLLTRDELQGVIAHEFSHILNGDMRLNIRLIGVLHGILVIAMLGYWIMRLNLHSSGRSRDKGSGASIALLGLLLLVIGYVGVFFGKLIKSAVSRQREYLADASAVQFTRNPEGIGGALKKIGGLASGSKINNTHAEEASHFFFSNGLKNSFIDLMATHPPLAERIRRIDPSFSAELHISPISSLSTTPDSGISQIAGTPERFSIKSDNVVSSIGTSDAEHINYASALLGSIPPYVSKSAREPYGARAVIYCLLLNKEKEPRAYQINRLSEYADPAVHTETLKLIPLIGSVEQSARFPLIDIAINSLRQLSAIQYEVFMENVDHLIKADEQIDLFEYMLQHIIKRTLSSTFTNPKPTVIQYYDINGLQTECTGIISCLSHWGSDNENEAQKAFDAGISKFHIKSKLELSSIETCKLDVLDAALNRFNAASPAIKKLVIRACIACISADGKVTQEEAELVRAVSSSLDCPMPPILPGGPLEEAA